jgi:hypothetical protein
MVSVKGKRNKVTIDEFLSGAETPFQRECREAWNDYNASDESLDELMALMELECYDGPCGDA